MSSSAKRLSSHGTRSCSMSYCKWMGQCAKNHNITILYLPVFPLWVLLDGMNSDSVIRFGALHLVCNEVEGGGGGGGI